MSPVAFRAQELFEGHGVWPGDDGAPLACRVPGLPGEPEVSLALGDAVAVVVEPLDLRPVVAAVAPLVDRKPETPRVIADGALCQPEPAGSLEAGHTGSQERSDLSPGFVAKDPPRLHRTHVPIGAGQVGIRDTYAGPGKGAALRSPGSTAPAV